MKRSEAFPSKYISKDDVDTPLVATIKAVRREVIGEGENEETKTTMYFQGEVKPLILNNANWMTCEDLYGEDSDMWIGKPIELYHDKTVMYGGKRVGGVRIRKAAGNGNGTKTVVFARDNEALMTRWQQLWNKAQELKIQVEPLPVDATFDEAVERGKTLKALIDMAA